MMRAVVSGLISLLFDKALDTVEAETPAAFATSLQIFLPSC